MKDWIPLLQALVWPLFVAAVLFWGRASVRGLFEAAADRVRQGAEVEVGPSGVKLGGIQAPTAAPQVATDTRKKDDLPHDIYITHWAWRDRTWDTTGKPYYRLRIAIDADEITTLQAVDFVMYHLHPTFRDPDRKITDRQSGFAFQTAAWGEFNMTADIHFKDARPPLTVERYINFLSVPSEAQV